MDKEINKEIEKNKEFKGKKELLKSIPGVGKVLSNTLVLELPELGKISNKEVSALVGLAPVNKDSGYFKEKRKIFGERPKVRKSIYSYLNSYTI